MRIWLLRVFALAGLAMSIYLIRQHVRFQSGGDVEQGLCSLVKASRCVATESSAFSSIGPVPTAGLGAMFFFMLLGYACAMWPGQAKPGVPPEGAGDASPRPDEGGAHQRAVRDFWSGAAMFAVAGFGAALFFGGVSLFVLKAFCIGCVIIYTITLGTLVIVFQDSPPAFLGRAAGGPAAAARLFGFIWKGGGIGFASLRRISILLVLLLAVPAFAVVPVVFTRKAQRAFADQILDKYIRQPRREFKVREKSLVKGRADAPLQIVVFADFQCPACRTLAGEMKKMLAKYPEGHYRMVYKHFPMDMKCNPLVERLAKDNNKTTFGHDRACEIAAKAQGFAEYGKFWDYYTEFYDLQGKTDMDPPLKDLAARAGIDFQDWLLRTRQTPNLREVVLDVGEALELQIMAVPTVFINGRMSPSARPEDVEFLLRIAPQYTDVEPPPTPAATATPTP